MKVNKRLRHFHSSPTPSEVLAIKGELYECFCYETIVNKYQNIKFVRLNENRHKRDGFYISTAGSLCYQSNSIDLGEFDIIGFDSKGNIHWYEITRQKTNLSVVEDKLKRKMELMKILFGQYTLYLILPEEQERLSSLAKVIYIPEPDYKKLMKPEYSFNFKSNNFLNIDYINKKAKKYDYIKELMRCSKDFFNNKNQKYESYLFERLYDLDNILNNSFSYFNVEEQRFGVIEIKNGIIYKDKDIKETKTATYKEIKKIRNKKQLEQMKKRKKNKK